MVTLNAKGVSAGTAVGVLHFRNKKPAVCRRTHIEDADAECARFREAVGEARRQLDALYEKALVEVGESGAAIFDVHRMMLEDEDLTGSVENIIRTQKVCAACAAASAGENFSAMFAAMDDGYMRARAADVTDVTDRLVSILNGEEPEQPPAAGSIICADDLSPSETVRLDRNAVAAFVMREGSSQSHTAILARTMSIPALIGAGGELKEEYDGRYAVVDGTSGTLVIDPDREALAEAGRKIAGQENARRLEEELKGKPTVTLDGRKIKLCANVGSLADIAAALKCDADGVGLFRSEFLYLESPDYPAEDRQFAVYRAAVENMAGRQVIIRTFDIGADKKIGYFDLPDEENPALGWRAIRICLDRPAVFRTQLRALCRASAYGNLAVMLPMVASLWELREAKRLLREVQEQLRSAGIAFDPDMKLGVMIETPAAALISGELAAEADFFSVGTNDLTQYTLAADRQNARLERYVDPHHPAVLSLIGTAVKNAHAHGVWCGVCGELAADPEMTEPLLRLGIDELSVAPGVLLGVRGKIRSISLN